MSDGDIEQAGWALDDPDTRLRRHHSPVLGLIALVLVLAGVGGIGVGIYRVATEAGPAEERVLGRGTVAALGGPSAPAAAFASNEAEKVTLWLEQGGLDNLRDTIVAGTTCEIARDDGTTDEIEGRIQGASVVTDNYSTIGETTTSTGPNVVSCRHVPFGQLQTRDLLTEETPFIVERGSPGDGLGGFWILSAGIVVLLLGVWAAARWRTGSLKPA